MDDGVKMVLALIGYLELRTVSHIPDAIGAATEALARRYWYACPTGCQISEGVIDGGLRWVMRFSQSLMSIASSGIPASLTGAEGSINEAFAKQMAEDITRPKDPSWRNVDWDRPWGWFNTQTVEEQRYFRDKFKYWGDTGREGVFGLVSSGKEKEIGDWIVLTHTQQIHHCQGFQCGN
jgi:hypothetical protein